MNETAGLRFRRVHRPQVITDELPEHRHKGSSTYSGKIFQVTLLSLGILLFLPLLVIILILESPIKPEVFTLKEPPMMKGCWEPNLKLREAQRLFEDQIIGPESISNIGDVLFSGTADGKIVKLVGRRIHTVTRLGKLPCGSREEEPTCGRPLGIRVGPNGTLFVADAYLGLFEVNPTTGEATRLVTGGQVVAGRKLAFINDVAVTQDGKKVYFTDSSSRWQRRDYMHLIMEATPDGRVLEYNTETKELTVVMEDLRFPNGMDTFVDNLPGFPDNIRPSSTGGYWVAMSAVRPNPGFSMLDFLSQRPWIKKFIFKLFSQDVLMKFVPRYSLVAELHDGGVCTRSFHDPNGLVAAYISEVHEYDGSLYLGSFRSPYIAKLDLSKV
ncbi:adipocyte plasma membrane-associated protein isoform X2 [Archocentrus centrarchus]|uniref:adipocyte plasma membrane-associated protein isoform X2 n=1 Tax=Archocentrus centrarchus TaxID=63155 RepID=UPI0011E9F2F0|nr:adipocyte plasma membrane-associated protein isoform X2 [Archocentrus centrarchus]